ncbi:hypothetical protein ACFFFP_06115 [Thermus composti]|uniref:Uncharacterized protein n=1 Tax=Thermus composti TaxID=532059 RepID=A0ABV6Q0V7_9DEIN|nr:hypothetical protein [Thermus composti]
MGLRGGLLGPGHHRLGGHGLFQNGVQAPLFQGHGVDLLGLPL